MKKHDGNTASNNKSPAKKGITALLGLLCGCLNGLFGSGGGVAAVPLLENAGIEAKKSHATSVALIFSLSLVTTIVYLLDGRLNLGLALDYLPYGIAGAVCGAILLKKIPDSLLRRVFGAVIVASAVRILLK